MPEKATLQRARRDKREGKSPSTQAGEFIHEEIHHIREGKHGVAASLDPERGVVTPNQIILVSNARFTQVGAAGSVAIPAGAEVIDLSS